MDFPIRSVIFRVFFRGLRRAWPRRPRAAGPAAAAATGRSRRRRSRGPETPGLGGIGWFEGGKMDGF